MLLELGWPAVVPDSESVAACQFVSASSTCCRPSGSPPDSSEMTRRDRKLAVQEVLAVECAHLQNADECTKCVHVMSDDGEEQKIPLSDLVDIVMKATENFKSAAPTHESSPEQIELCDYKEKRKESNKIAAIKYRERQKKKAIDMKQERAKLEKRNKELKVLADALQQEVQTLRQQILENGEFRVR